MPIFLLVAGAVFSIWGLAIFLDRKPGSRRRRSSGWHKDTSDINFPFAADDGSSSTVALDGVHPHHHVHSQDQGNDSHQSHDGCGSGVDAGSGHVQMDHCHGGFDGGFDGGGFDGGGHHH